MTVSNATLDDLDMTPSTQDSDPSLSSINAPSWYNSQNPSLPSTSADPTDFQMSSISIEPDVDSDSLGRSNDVINCKESCINKGPVPETDKVAVDIQRFNVPIKIYPGNTRYQSLSYSHISQSQFPCPVQGCSSILRTRTALRKHALVHAERKFTCNQCGKSFAERTKLNRHMLIHTGERAFKCNYEGCDKAFSLEANLKSHIKTHTGTSVLRNFPLFLSHVFSEKSHLRIFL
ncbi:zinc finger, C2H2 type [Oesophagostomum dentatum]|uniref:Zinc finger, C2H2 type n=1 Tax=Oesophagostomum dentatum TaxID=61180 RepID=A0A0B1RVH3_OESDE|nr:zinc finger, C2H2 type [Oesophagostomum dentatum]